MVFSLVIYMKLTELNTYIGNDVRIDCGFELQTCNTAAFCIPEGVVMALDRYTISTCGLLICIP